MISLEKAESLVSMFPKYLKIAGSIARGNENVKDIDVLSMKDLNEVKEDMLKIFPDAVVEKQGSNYLRLKIVVDGIDIGIDIWKTTKENLLFAMFHYIGNKNFNIRSRMQAKRLGYKLTQYGIFNLKNNKRIDVKNEKELFKILNITYIPPIGRK